MPWWVIVILTYYKETIWIALGLVGLSVARDARDPRSNPTSDILPCRLGHENISTVILPLPLIQEEQLFGRLVQEQFGSDN